MPIIWQMPDGSVRVTVLADQFLSRGRLPGETDDVAVSRLADVIRAKTPSLATANLKLLVPTAEVAAMDRSKRDQWRIVGGRLGVRGA